MTENIEDLIIYKKGDCINLWLGKDDINVESDCYQTSGPGREVCKICLKPFEKEPKIRCAECENIVLCLQCFSLGLETQKHRCTHSYHIDRRHISNDPDTDWSLGEDNELLQAILDYGYGNDVDLGKRFMNRTVSEIKNRIDSLLGLDKAPLRACFEVTPKPVVKYQSESFKEEPPRYPTRCHAARTVAGYCAPRGDFETEYENRAEEELRNLDTDAEDDSEEELTKNLSCAIVECYNEKLKERARRKQVIKHHGLLLKRASYFLSISGFPQLLVFMQLQNGDEFESLVQSLNMENMKWSQFRRLRKYRELGITTLRGCTMYDKLDNMRVTAAREFNRCLKPTTPFPSILKKPRQPLDISQFSGYDVLTCQERELCSTNRLLPDFFLKCKAQLLEVNAAEGGIRLSHARRLLKIDVNKTRKIFDLLRDSNLINVLT